MTKHSSPIRSALADAQEIFAGLSATPLICLDYDGTLAPIVERPDLATMPTATRSSLLRLRERAHVAIVSGRALPDVSSRVGIDRIYYAGNHGFEITGPGGLSHTVGNDAREGVRQIDAALRAQLWHIPGVLIEDKRFTLSVHVRQTAPERIAEVEHCVRETLHGYPALALHEGKKVLEIRPRIDWNKGRALDWILNALSAPRDAAIYIGDDRTDEDAFAVLAEAGVPILVASEPRATAARFGLRDPGEVARFLESLCTWLARGGMQSSEAK